MSQRASDAGASPDSTPDRLEAATSLKKRLKVDLLCILSCSSGVGGEKKSYRMLLRGWKDDAFLLLEPAPSEMSRSGMRGPRRSLLLFPREPVVVRFVSEGDVFAMQTVVQELIYIGETPNILIRWPREIEMVRVRQYDRLTVNLPAELLLEGGQRRPARMLDLGPNGCRLATVVGLVLEQTLTMRVTLPAQDAPLVLSGAVASLEREEAAFVAGISFTSVDALAASQIQGYIELRKRLEGSVESE